ncbi:MAG: hypothetical protein JNK74_25130 [Candidatus Hydrogenedentes bacterium]|nr:hypothetical protein [Candidatus Hydrogenedentota bacterium]
MKKSLILTFAGALALATLGTTAFAETTIDKGDLGTYVRQGRFVKPILTTSTRTEAIATPDESKALINKGDLGTYERKGRFLKPVLNVGLQGWSADTPEATSTVMHEHGLNGKEHKNSSK